MGLPRGPLTRRFGPGVLLRLDQALGRLPQALKYRRPASPWAARLAFAEPISAPEDLGRVAADLAGLLCAQLQTAGRAARRFALSYHRLDGRSLTVEAGLAPTQAPLAALTLASVLVDLLTRCLGLPGVAEAAEAEGEAQVLYDTWTMSLCC